MVPFNFKYFLFLFLFTQVLPGQQLHHLKTHELIERQLINYDHAEAFASLQVQDFQGRVKPIHSLSLDLLRKIYGKSTFTYRDKTGHEKKLTPTQVFIGMQLKPDSWQLLPCIKVNETAIPELKSVIKINDKGFATPAQFFDFTGTYKLKERVAMAFAKAPGKRNAIDKDIIKIDERVNIIWSIFGGNFLRIFPNKNDTEQKWYASSEAPLDFPEEDNLFFQRILPTYFVQLEEGIKTKDWQKADETLIVLKNFQKQKGGAIVLPDRKVKWEIWFNKAGIFLYCLIFYSILGLLLILLSFSKIFSPENRWITILSKITLGLLVITFFYHASGILIRWYISGHAPWSNGYEATIFIAWVGMLAGLVFARKNHFAPAVSAVMAFCLLGIAHGSLMNPELTNLVPVLKSYWLLIHVAVITGSYGFLGLGSLLAFITLIIMSMAAYKTENKRFQKSILELSTINQLTSTLGLYLLTIGTFLGGIWANESWGRYWGWDPKETWALISIIIYSFVLHIRIIIPQNYLYVYNVCSLFAIGSILMTFFGVNYYLSGLHSYAKGDPFPIPQWIYIVFILALCISILPKIIAALRSKSKRKPILHSAAVREIL